MKTRKKSNFTTCARISLFIAIACSYNNFGNAATSVSTSTNLSTSAVPKPHGVNFGGVFTLEDWFFSDKKVGHNVMTTCADSKTGIASSQLFTGDTSKPDFKWTSEIDLINKLFAHGYTEKDIETIFQKHRDTYLGKQPDGSGYPTLSASFVHAKNLGLKVVRLPITWAIQYDKPYVIKKANGADQEILATTGKIQLIPDPFYADNTDNINKKWASIPISQIKAILEAANSNGIQIILDIHAFPGGSSDGTYNGVWPLAPKFWSTTPDIYRKNFETIFGNLVDWANSLPKDSAAFKGLAGLTPMNEPAHMMGSVRSTHLESLKPNPNPNNITVCSAAGPGGSSGVISWADAPSNNSALSPKDILNTLALAVKKFSDSKLGDYGVKLYMNVIETMYDSSETKPFTEIGNWWKTVTTDAERTKWAVLDIHHYTAWSPECNNVLSEKVTVVAANRDDAFKIKKDANGNLEIWQNQGVVMLLDKKGEAKTPKLDNSGKPIFDSSGKLIDVSGISFTPMTYLTNANSTLTNGDGSYTINNYGLGQIRNCSDWFSTIRTALGLPTPNLLAASEFSAGTNSDAWRSGASGKAQIDGKPMTVTNSKEYRDIFLEEQIKNANNAQIETIFWTWAIPHNSNYQNEWSLSNIYNVAN
jgi:hypothetical protein